MNERVYIVASDAKAAAQAAYELGLPKTAGAHWGYVSSERVLRGRTRLRVHYAPGWEAHRQAFEIKASIDHIGDVEVI